MGAGSGSAKMFDFMRSTTRRRGDSVGVASASPKTRFFVSASEPRRLEAAELGVELVSDSYPKAEEPLPLPLWTGVEGHERTEPSTDSVSLHEPLPLPFCCFPSVPKMFEEPPPGALITLQGWTEGRKRQKLVSNWFSRSAVIALHFGKKLSK